MMTLQNKVRPYVAMYAHLIPFKLSIHLKMYSPELH